MKENSELRVLKNVILGVKYLINWPNWPNDLFGTNVRIQDSWIALIKICWKYCWKFYDELILFQWFLNEEGFHYF